MSRWLLGVCSLTSCIHQDQLEAHLLSYNSLRGFRPRFRPPLIKTAIHLGMTEPSNSNGKPIRHYCPPTIEDIIYAIVVHH